MGVCARPCVYVSVVCPSACPPVSTGVCVCLSVLSVVGWSLSVVVGLCPSLSVLVRLLGVQAARGKTPRRKATRLPPRAPPSSASSTFPRPVTLHKLALSVCCGVCYNVTQALRFYKVPENNAQHTNPRCSSRQAILLVVRVRFTARASVPRKACVRRVAGNRLARRSRGIERTLRY